MQASTSSEVRAKTAGSPAFETHDAATQFGVPKRLGDNLVLLPNPRPAVFADVDLDRSGGVAEDRRIAQPVVEHHVGGGEQFGAAEGQQLGIARPGADQRDVAPAGRLDDRGKWERS